MSSKNSKKAVKKEIPNLQFKCKFRGKYDLNKNKNNKELDLDNAIKLFEVIHKKNENLYKETQIKMYSNRKMFMFVDKRTLAKVHHRVPYMQVSKFFILKRDLKMVILGVHHKAYRWFLVFQFNTDNEATRFCDEIEGQKKILSEQLNINATDDTPAVVVEGDEEDIQIYETERHSIHDEMLNDHQYANNDMDDSFYQPELEPEVMNERNMFEEPSLYSASSRSSSDYDDRVHCDDMKQSKLKELYMTTSKRIYADKNDWSENVSCVDYPNKLGQVKESKNGPVYLYCASHKVEDDKSKAESISSSSSDDEDEQFVQYKPKLVSKNYSSENYTAYEPRMIYLNH